MVSSFLNNSMGECLSSAFGGLAGSVSSQILSNLQKEESLSEGMDKAVLYGLGGGSLVGAFKWAVSDTYLIPANIGKIFSNSAISDEILSRGTGEIINEFTAKKNNY